MKITRIFLENFIGIFAGTGRHEIDIDFTKNKNRIIILNGGNGSGKSTLKSLMHPLRGTFDNRKSIVLPNELGHSICELLLNDGRKVVTEHFYGKKNKSFISVDGEELNESGSIREFEKIAEEVLGITSDYFKIGSLGSNVLNFMDQTTTQRKTYINKFIPAVDDYLIAFDTVKEKHKTLLTEIKLIKGNIEKYSKLRELNDIKDELKSLKKNKDNLTEEYMNSKNELKSLEEKYESYKNDVYEIISNNEYIDEDSYDASSSISDLSIVFDEAEYEYEEQEKELKQQVELLIEKYNIQIGEPKTVVTTLLNKNNDKITKLVTETELLLENIDEIQKNIIEVNNKIEEYENKLKTCNSLSENEIISIKEKISEYEKLINISEMENEKLFKNIKKDFKLYEDFYSNNTINEINMIPNKLKDIFDNIEAFKEDYSVEDFNSYYEELEVIDFKDIKEISSKISELEEKIKKTEIKIEKIKTMEKSFSNNLNERPDNCKIDNCPFISSSVEFMNNEFPKLSILEKQIEKDNKTLITLNEKIDKLNKFKSINSFELKVIEQLKKIIPDCIFYSIINKDLFIENLFACKEYALISDYVSYKLNLVNHEKLVNSRETLNDKINNYSLSESIFKEYNQLIESNKNKVSEYNEKLTEVKNHVDSNNALIEKTKIRISICNKILEVINDYEEISEIVKIFHNNHKILQTKIKQSKEITEIIVSGSLSNKVIRLSNSIKELDDKINQTISDIKIIETNLERLKEIESSFELLEDLKSALDPKSGIPLIFINSFLTNISQKTNELLSLAYNDEFKIKFEVTSSEFAIRVFKSDGTSLEDITQASQGEQSLTNMSLSLAMIENVVNKDSYNIIALDEVDATLSTENRRLFIDMLDKQLDMLDCEQCFVISHNGEFYNKDVDMILFNDHDCDLNDKDFMKNKNILANFG